MITVIEYGQNLVKLLYFNSFAAIKFYCALIVLIRTQMPSPHSLYDLRVILIVYAYIYMDMNFFGLVCVVSSWLRVGSVAADSFSWVVGDGFG